MPAPRATAPPSCHSPDPHLFPSCDKPWQWIALPVGADEDDPVRAVVEASAAVEQRLAEILAETAAIKIKIASRSVGLAELTEWWTKHGTRGLPDIELRQASADAREAVDSLVKEK